MNKLDATSLQSLDEWSCYSKDYTPSRKIKRLSYSLVANWVKESWDAIDPNMIMRSFKCCDISNAIDGTEDNLIFDFNKVQKVNNTGRGIEEED